MHRSSPSFRGELPLLAFGLSFALFSSFGQTFLISLFVPSFAREFSLTDGTFGALYSGATLASAAVLPWAGQRLDHVRLTRFTTAVVLLLAASGLVLASAPHVALLGAALVGLRLSGQGLSTHTAYTAMARYGGARRGRALSIASLGFPMGEAALPLLTTFAIAALGWRRTWLLFALVAVTAFLPILIASLRRSGIELDPRRLGSEGDHSASRGKGDAEVVDAADSGRSSGDWTRAEVLRDPRFRLALPAALLPSFWLTGIFLYQTRIAEMKGWSVTLIASAFVGFALSRVVFALVAGRLVDRVTARRAYPFVILPLAAALLVPLLVEAAWAAYGMMVGFGMTIGLAEPVRSSLWAELYGVRHLGAIKAMIAAFGVVGAAGSPVLIGLSLDAGVDVDRILLAGIATTLVGVLLALRMAALEP